MLGSHALLGFQVTAFQATSAAFLSSFPVLDGHEYLRDKRTRREHLLPSRD